jgi:catechol 2,3-dioxygenase-like lactoylglutathione lyase family enzyme
MVQTYGLTHINLTVPGLGRTLRYYEQVFGLREYGRGDGLVHTRPSGRRDILSFAWGMPLRPVSAAASHVSAFDCPPPANIDRAVAEAESAGGRLLRRGEFAVGRLRSAYIADPDG